MKIIISKSYKAASPKNSEWVYKGHTCKIELDYEEDNIKAYHTVIKPNGETVYPDISPYDTTQETLNMWIDAGYPSGSQFNYTQQDLKALMSKKVHRGILPPDDNNTPWLTNQEPPKV